MEAWTLSDQTHAEMVGRSGRSLFHRACKNRNNQCIYTFIPVNMVIIPIKMHASQFQHRANSQGPTPRRTRKMDNQTEGLDEALIPDLC
jgi:hypothetical protein